MGNIALPGRSPETSSARKGSNESSQIDVARLLPEVRIFLGLFQELIELTIEQLPLVLLRGKRLLERFLAPARRAFELGDLDRQVLNHRLPLGFCVRDDRAEFRIDLQSR